MGWNVTLPLSTKPHRSHLERLRKPCSTWKQVVWKQVVWKRHGGSWLATSHCRHNWHEKMKKWSRYVAERPHRYHRQLMSVFVSAGLISAPGTPCCWKLKKQMGVKPERRRLEVLHLFRCFTHTHTHIYIYTHANARTHAHAHTPAQTQTQPQQQQ